MTGLRAAGAASTGIASTGIASADGDSTGWRFALPAGEFDRRPALLGWEAEALGALNPTELRRNRARGLPRRTAADGRPWRAWSNRWMPPERPCTTTRTCAIGAPARTPSPSS